jgi:hypothetical protein
MCTKYADPLTKHDIRLFRLLCTQIFMYIYVCVDGRHSVRVTASELKHQVWIAVLRVRFSPSHPDIVLGKYKICPRSIKKWIHVRGVIGVQS